MTSSTQKMLEHTLNQISLTKEPSFLIQTTSLDNFNIINL